jgi:hypothetical protein
MQGWGRRDALAWLLSCASALGVVATTSSGRAAEGADTSGPAYSTDSDGDGTVDALDACPTGAAPGTSRSSDPKCYLGAAGTAGMTWLAAKYRQNGSNGSFWRDNRCNPAKAYPVDDVTSDGQTFKGVVILGFAEISDSGMKPAGCLVSIDYGKVPVVALADVRTLADLYDSHNPQFTNTPSYAPNAGFGLIRGSGISTIVTRIEQRPKVQRLAFTRGVMYGVDLSAYQSQCQNGLCITTTSPPKDWSFLPTGLDAALIGVRDAIHDALNSPDAKDFDDAIDEAIEGVPQTLRLDDRYPTATPKSQELGLDKVQPEYTLSTHARIYAPSSYTGQDDPNDPWVIVPASIANLGLEFLARPLGQVQYSPQRSDNDTLLVYQSFALPNAYADLAASDVTRNVEVVWPGDNPAAATSEANPAFGSRWTSNAGPTDCWNSEDDPDPVTYAFTAADPDNAKIAEAWCPAEQVNWWKLHPETNAQSGAEQKCQAFQDATTDYKNGWSALGRGLESLPCVLSEEFARAPVAVADCGGCAGSTLLESFCAFQCDVCDDCCSDCTDDVAATLPAGDLDTKVTTCVFPQFIGDAAEQIGEIWDEHWPYTGDDEHRLVPVVGMVRTKAASEVHSVEGHITHEGDLMLGHSHQLTDWNWGMGDAEAYDPMYLQIGKRRDVDNEWTGLEVELEFGIPYGRWRDGGRAPDAFDLHGHTGLSYLAPGGPDFELLGQVWPNNSCDLLGIDMDGDSHGSDVPTLTCGGTDYPAPFIDPSTHEPIDDIPAWRKHFGRGLFVPMPLTEELISDGMPFQVNETPENGMYMSLADDWPQSSSGFSGTDISFDDWKDYPRRLGFLGQPIIDCGHKPFRTEIHPPQVITMEAFNRRYRAQDASGVSLSGLPHDKSVEAMAFGWVNVTSPNHLEFDLWPTPRPSAAAKLVVRGHDLDLSPNIAKGRSAFFVNYGYAIDADAPQHGTSAPTLSCTPQPVDFPNHVHCEYDDPAGDDPNAAFETGDYGNPRMTPFYATSRFEMRINMEWE